MNKRQTLLNNARKVSKVIGEGTYGKVYRPPYGTNNAAQVGKVFSRPSNWKEEINIGNQMRKINQGENFIVLPETISEKNKQVLQIRYGYAGVSYIKYLRGLPELENPEVCIETTKHTILLMCKFLEKYMLTFGKSDLVHMDIKPDNVMYSEVDDALRLIDFSMAMKDADVFNPAVSRVRFSISKAYPFYSPEFNTFCSRMSVKDMENPVTRRILISAMTGIFSDGMIKSICQDSIDSTLEKYKDDTAAQDTSNTHAQDAWSIGITFLLYLETIIKKYYSSWSVNNVKRLYNNTNAKQYLPDIIYEAIDIIVDTLLCANTDRSIIDCKEDLEKLR